MKTINFYTINGWAGKNYDDKLSTKEIAAKVRAFARQNFKGFKFSIRYEWGLTADSINIELKGGPVAPFIPGSRSELRNHFETMDRVTDFGPEELAPEIYQAVNEVMTYAMSFRYDDSDGREDYFDTNFYLRIRVEGSDYQLVEAVQVRKNAHKAESVEHSDDRKPDSVAQPIEVVEYSTKSIAVFGDTRALADRFKQMGGRYNRSLSFNGCKRSGWIFCKWHTEEVRRLVGLAMSGNLAESASEDSDKLPVVVDNPGMYAMADYTTDGDTMGGYRLGEVVYDQCGEIGVILAFYKGGEVRLTSNGVCDVDELKKCPRTAALNALASMEIIRPSSTDLQSDDCVAFYEKKA